MRKKIYLKNLFRSFFQVNFFTIINKMILFILGTDIFWRFNQIIYTYIHPSIHIMIYPSIYPYYDISIHLSILWYIYPSIHIMIYPSIYPYYDISIHLSILWYIYLSIYFFFSLSIYLEVKGSLEETSKSSNKRVHYIYLSRGKRFSGRDE